MKENVIEKALNQNRVVGVICNHSIDFGNFPKDRIYNNEHVNGIMLIGGDLKFLNNRDVDVNSFTEVCNCITNAIKGTVRYIPTGVSETDIESFVRVTEDGQQSVFVNGDWVSIN
jgi:hypothetical protein